MNHMTMNLLTLTGVTVRLGMRTVLAELSATVAAGEMLGLIGPNGAGKSTLVKAIAQLLPYQGGIHLAGQSLRKMAPRQRATQLAYLAQADEVHWPLTVAELVALGRYPYQGQGVWSGRASTSQAGDRAAIEAALHDTDLWALRGCRIDRLSGGERARARLARALAVQAKVLLADEPVAAFDPEHRLRVMALLADGCRGKERATVIVLHDLTLAARFCDRLLLLDGGRLIASGTPEEVLTRGHLQTVYGIEALFGEHQGQRYVLPWACRAQTSVMGPPP